MDIKQTGKFVSELRCERKMTQKDLAEQLNVTDKAISRWETGRGLPDADSMLALSVFFNVTIRCSHGKKIYPSMAGFHFIKTN